MCLGILNPLDCIQCLPLQPALVEGLKEAIGHVCFSVSNSHVFENVRLNR